MASRPASRASLLDAMSEASQPGSQFKCGSAAAALFAPSSTVQEGMLQTGAPDDDPSLLFFQLPVHLPVAAPSASASAAASPAASPAASAVAAERAAGVTPVRATDYLATLASTHPEGSSSSCGDAAGARPAPLKQLPGGQLGELVVYKSGKVMLSIGGMLLDVHPGADTTFDQEIVALDETQAAAGGTAPLCRLGKLEQRLVVTPNLDDLLARCAHEEAQQPLLQAASVQPVSAQGTPRKRPTGGRGSTPGSSA